MTANNNAKPNRRYNVGRLGLLKRRFAEVPDGFFRADNSVIQVHFRKYLPTLQDLECPHRLVVFFQ